MKRRIVNKKTGDSSVSGHKANTARSKPVRRKRESTDFKSDPIAVKILNRINRLGVAGFGDFHSTFDPIAAPSTIRKKLVKLKAAGLIDISHDSRGSGRPMRVHLLGRGEKILGELRKRD